MNHKNKIAIVGLGYVGLPLARLFATKYPVVGFDINPARVQELKSGKDATLELEDHLLQSVLLNENPAKDKTGLFCSDQIEDIADANIYIITVPTPVDKNNRPVLTPLYKSSETVGKVLKKRRYCYLRIYCLSGSDRRGMHSGFGKSFRINIQRRFFRRLFTRTHQSR